MSIEKHEIEQYLEEVKSAVLAGRYRIEMNKNRQANLALFKEYVIDEKKSREIILDLTIWDFCQVLKNKHKKFVHERLYVFGKEVKLLQRFGDSEETVALYIKFNKLEDQFVIVISFHRQEHILEYAFK